MPAKHMSIVIKFRFRVETGVFTVSVMIILHTYSGANTAKNHNYISLFYYYNIYFIIIHYYFVKKVEEFKSFKQIPL